MRFVGREGGLNQVLAKLQVDVPTVDGVGESVEARLSVLYAPLRDARLRLQVDRVVDSTRALSATVTALELQGALEELEAADVVKGALVDRRLRVLGMTRSGDLVSAFRPDALTLNRSMVSLRFAIRAVIDKTSPQWRGNAQLQFALGRLLLQAGRDSGVHPLSPIRCTGWRSATPTATAARARLSLSGSHGTLALAHTKCITRSVSLVSDAAEHEMLSRIAFEANVSCANLVLASTLYTSEPHLSGADSLNITAVAEVNDAPYLVSATDIYEGDKDVPLVVHDFRIVDPDAPSDAVLIRVVLRAALISLALLEKPLSSFTAAVTTAVVADGRNELRVLGTLQDVNRGLATLVYTSACDWNSVDSTFDDSTSDGYDAITATVPDTPSSGVVAQEHDGRVGILSLSSLAGVIVEDDTSGSCRKRLRVSAFTFDECTTAASKETRLVVQVSDVDAAEPACAPTPWSCEMDVMLVPGHGTITLLSCAEQTPRHRVRVLVQTRGNVTTCRSLALGHVRSADDRDTFGKEGLLAITIVFYKSLAKRQLLRGLAVVAPIDAVLSIPEDSRNVFRAQSLRIHDADMASAALASLLSALNSSVYVLAPDWYGTEALLLLPNSASTSMCPLVAHEDVESAVTTSRLLFARLDIRGHIGDLNAALRRMLMASSSCTGGGSDSNVDADASASIVTLWPWILGESDAPRDADLQLASFSLRVELSPFHCRLRPRVVPLFLRDQLGLSAAVEADLNSEGRVGETTTLTLNEAVLRFLVFRAAANFHGLTLVMLEVSDLCKFGLRGTETRTYAQSVRMYAVNDGPEIHAPPFDPQD
ncbi:hypothetical protein PybrP1_002171 [[Pythium] brassicae (nom. inval.)]|nr:hypothetical protein PybrP1_002171 [[Pythium] brassicae (nom. inval.)]